MLYDYISLSVLHLIYRIIDFQTDYLNNDHISFYILKYEYHAILILWAWVFQLFSYCISCLHYSWNLLFLTWCIKINFFSGNRDVIGQKDKKWRRSHKSCIYYKKNYDNVDFVYLQSDLKNSYDFWNELHKIWLQLKTMGKIYTKEVYSLIIKETILIFQKINIWSFG